MNECRHIPWCRRFGCCHMGATFDLRVCIICYSAFFLLALDSREDGNERLVTEQFCTQVERGALGKAITTTDCTSINSHEVVLNLVHTGQSNSSLRPSVVYQLAHLDNQTSFNLVKCLKTKNKQLQKSVNWLINNKQKSQHINVHSFSVVLISTQHLH